MWPYWLMFLVPAVAAFAESRRPSGAARLGRRTRLNAGWWGVAIILTLLIGLRFEVGGDWYNYVRNLENASHWKIGDVLLGSDPGYRLLEWFATQFNLGVFGVNLIAAALFSFGLAIFCRDLPRPWLALSMAIPYLVIIVAMGYTRQGIAIGCSMIALTALGRQRVLPFLIWVFLAATFHKSAVLLFPIAALAATQRRLWIGFWVSLISFGAYRLMLEDAFQGLTVNYLEAGYQSEGALVRLLMNALPAALLLILRRRFQMSVPQQKLWAWFAIISLALLIVYYYSPSSTAVDRVALYMLPLQLVVFSYLPEVLGLRRGRNDVLVLAILLYYASVLFVWLNYATHAFAWLPYKFYPFEGVF